MITPFEMAVSSVRVGIGVKREVGMDLKRLGTKLAMVVTDPIVAKLPPVRTTIESLEQNGIAYALYQSRARRAERRNRSSTRSRLDREQPFDTFVAVGGGSTIDTAKANLYTTYPPADFLDYVNPQIGKDLPVPGPLNTLMAIPTTAGTGSETTGVAIFDYKKLRREDRHRESTVEADARLSRSREHAHHTAGGGGIDGLDILRHAIESLTAIRYTERPLPERPTYQGRQAGGSTPDFFAARPLRVRAVRRQNQRTAILSLSFAVWILPPHGDLW